MTEAFPVTRIKRPKCARCRDTGVWHYDENHGCPCPDCCSHADWWVLGEFYDGNDDRFAACGRGCGTTLTKIEYEAQHA